jgi:hypothetical protein
VESGLYEFLPELSRGNGVPSPAPRMELTIADRAPEAPLEDGGETLWYRMIAGGPVPRYVRLRPRPSLSAIIGERLDLPDGIEATVEILSLRPPMCYGLPA